jgi:hypothetical protein
MASSIINSDDGVVSGTSGLKTTGGDDGVLNIQNNGTTAVTVNASGNVGIGGTADSNSRLHIFDSTSSADRYTLHLETFIPQIVFQDVSAAATDFAIQAETSSLRFKYGDASTGTDLANEAMRIDSSGNLLVGTTTNGTTVKGIVLRASGETLISRDSDNPLLVNRLGNDGDLVQFRQANTQEGSISVSGTTVSYNGGHLSRWAQTTTAKDESLKKGTVLSNLDEMNVYVDADGNPVENEQLNKVKVSDVEGDANVAGVFVNWTYDEAHSVDEINMAMTGDMIIRIAEGVTVARGDLLMSAGDGTAKPQGDDIVRSKTIAKVTSTHVTCIYDDGSYCVPCVLMAC